MTTLTQKIEAAMDDRGWTAEEKAAWSFERRHPFAKSFIKPRAFIDDRERWSGMLIPVADFLPEGATLKAEGMTATVSETGHLHSEDGESLGLRVDDLFDIVDMTAKPEDRQRLSDSVEVA